MLDTAIIVMSWVVRVTGYTCVLVMNGRTALLFISYSAEDLFYLFFRTHPRDISQFAFIQVYSIHYGRSVTHFEDKRKFRSVTTQTGMHAVRNEANLGHGHHHDACAILRQCCK